MAVTYNVYFGEVGTLTLVSEGQAAASWDIDVGPLTYGQEYNWRVDSINDYGVTLGEVWTFTALVFVPPADSDRATTRHVVAAANSKIWYEDI